MSCLQQQPFISLFYCEATEQASNWNRKKWTRVPHLTPKSKGCLFLSLKDQSAARRKRRASKFFCCFFLYSWQYQHYRYCLVLNNRATQKEKSLSNNFISARSQIQHSSQLGSKLLILREQVTWCCLAHPNKCSQKQKLDKKVLSLHFV